MDIIKNAIDLVKSLNKREKKGPGTHRVGGSVFRQEPEDFRGRFQLVQHTLPNRAERRRRERAGYNVDGRRNSPVERAK